jgi:hypothetical protein
MKSLTIAGLFITGILIGIIASNWWSWHEFKRQLPTKSVDLAFMASQKAEWLAHLRLNETKQAIEQIETSLNASICAMAQYERATHLAEQERQTRDKCLIPVKIYYQNFPVHGDEAKLVIPFMAQIPERNIQSSCKSAICRLDDLRLDAANPNKNATPK